MPTAVQRKSPDATGEHREHGPPDDDSRQHPARAEPVSQAARGNLEQAIGDGEGSQHKAHLGMRNAEFRLHVRRGLADADAVKIENERQGAEKRQHAVTDARGRRMRVQGARIQAIVVAVHESAASLGVRLREYKHGVLRTAY